MKTLVKKFIKNNVLITKFALLFIISLFVIFSISSCSQQRFIASKWQRDEYNQVENIPVLDYLYDSESKLLYLVTNDINNLYIHLKAIEETVQTKILMFGFTVWIDTTARNKKQIGIKYPLARNDREQIMTTGLNRSGNVRSNFQENKTKIIDQLNEIELIGFEGKKSISHIYAKNENDIRGEITFGENGDLQYKLTLPLGRIGIDTIKNETVLSLLMESGKMEIAGPSGGGGRPGGGAMGGGGRGGAGGAMGGGGQGGAGGMGRNPQAMQGGKSEVSQPVNIKLKIKLSKNDDI